MAKAFLREADFVSSKQGLSEALSVDRDIGAKADTALDQITLAKVASAQKEEVDIGTLRSAVDELRVQKMTDDEIEAEVALAREIMQQGKTAEAAQMLKQTTVLSAAA